MIFILKKPALAADPVEGSQQYKEDSLADSTEATSVDSLNSVDDPFDISELSPINASNPRRMPRRNSLVRNISLSLRDLFKTEEPATRPAELKRKPTPRRGLQRKISNSLRDLFRTSSKSKLEKNTKTNHCSSNNSRDNKTSSHVKAQTHRRGLGRRHHSMRILPSKHEDIVLNGISDRKIGRKHRSLRSVFPPMEEIDETKEVQWTPPEASDKQRVLPRASRSWRSLFSCGRDNMEDAVATKNSNSHKKSVKVTNAQSDNNNRRALLDRSISASQMQQRRRNKLRGARPGVYRQASSHCFSTTQQHQAMSNLNMKGLLSEYEKIVDPSLAGKLASDDESVTGW